MKTILLLLTALQLVTCALDAAEVILVRPINPGDHMVPNGTGASWRAAIEEKQRALIIESNRIRQATNDILAAARWKRSAATNDAKILAWTRTRAGRGEASGQYELGLRYLRGHGVTNDLVTASNWLSRAAAQGHAFAGRELASLTNGVPPR